MLETFLPWLAHWLPLVQGFAALASIGGALLSWKYALKAQRAREQMTQNLVTSRLIEAFDTVVAELHDFRATAILPDGKLDAAAYRLKEQHHKRLLEEIAALATAATPYLKAKPGNWNGLLDKLASAATNPIPDNIEYVCKFLVVANAHLKLAATTREMAPSA